MVINYEGGSKAKKKGRKFFKYKNIGKEKGVRLPDSDEELFAVVKKVHSGKIVDVVNLNNQVMKCRVGNKFMGFNSKDNKLSMGVWVLVGKREWEVRDINKTQFVDLLEVYNDGEVKNLKKILKDSIDFAVFKKYMPDEICSFGENLDEIEFVSEETLRYENMINNSSNVKPKKSISRTDKYLSDETDFTDSEEEEQIENSINMNSISNEINEFSDSEYELVTSPNQTNTINKNDEEIDVDTI